MGYVLTRGGLGDAVTASRNVQVGGALAGSAATAIVGSIAASGGTILGITASAMIPVVGPIIAGAALVISMLVANSGCGVTCVETSSWANQAAAQLQIILDGYFALPAPRTDAQKAVAVAAFNTVWQKLQQLCGQPGTGNAGVRCISDRQAGACTWKQKYTPVYPGESNVGECWNWFNGYLGPIQQDPTVPDSSAAATLPGSIAGALAGDTGSLLPLLVIGGLVALGVAL